MPVALQPETGDPPPSRRDRPDRRRGDRSARPGPKLSRLCAAEHRRQHHARPGPRATQSAAAPHALAQEGRERRQRG
eukprot:162553-Rhodomonas_salina.4